MHISYPEIFPKLDIRRWSGRQPCLTPARKYQQSWNIYAYSGNPYTALHELSPRLSWKVRLGGEKRLSQELSPGELGFEPIPSASSSPCNFLCRGTQAALGLPGETASCSKSRQLSGYGGAITPFAAASIQGSGRGGAGDGF